MEIALYIYCFRAGIFLMVPTITLFAQHGRLPLVDARNAQRPDPFVWIADRPAADVAEPRALLELHELRRAERVALQPQRAQRIKAAPRGRQRDEAVMGGRQGAQRGELAELLGQRLKAVTVEQQALESAKRAKRRGQRAEAVPPAVEGAQPGQPAQQRVGARERAEAQPLQLQHHQAAQVRWRAQRRRRRRGRRGQGRLRWWRTRRIQRQRV